MQSAGADASSVTRATPPASSIEECSEGMPDSPSRRSQAAPLPIRQCPEVSGRNGNRRPSLASFRQATVCGGNRALKSRTVRSHSGWSEKNRPAESSRGEISAKSSAAASNSLQQARITETPLKISPGIGIADRGRCGCGRFRRCQRPYVCR